MAFEPARDSQPTSRRRRASAESATPNRRARRDHGRRTPTRRPRPRVRISGHREHAPLPPADGRAARQQAPLRAAAVAERRSRRGCGSDSRSATNRPKRSSATWTQLCAWGAVDSIQDSSRASSTREFKRKRFTYDITAAGEIAERAALQVDRIAERIGALERSQLPELLDALIALAVEAERTDPRPASSWRCSTTWPPSSNGSAPTQATSCASSER